MDIAAFDYELPEELIAQEPAARREESRLLRLPLDGGELSEHRFAELPGLLESDDLLVLNDARVLPARLWARRSTGAELEILLLRRVDPGDGEGGDDVGGDDVGGDGEGGDGEGGDDVGGDDVGGEAWLALVGPARKARAGEELVLPGSDEGREVRVRVVEERGEGRRLLRFPPDQDVGELMQARGAMPLPPYIHRERSDPRGELDRRRYQTVYAARAGAVAAPTAGLHFTDGVLERLDRRGVERATLTLDVGPGTFQPVRTERVEDHEMLPERYRIPQPTVEAITAARRRGGRVVAVGTTVVRALEHAASRGPGDQTGGTGEQAPGGSAGEADLFITPGFEFRVIDGMLTNFHLPRSTPILMVAALAGRERLLEAYRLAVERRFRFYSYGDAMLLL